ncbi:MAG: cupin domain-containing protein [Deltaproteobacteria bacterium]|nr:cupin domain-containing protein [Deltaproteobacteria bacterium]MBI3389064.1 cupin domain-containing protein [Deltaproteobacteria bacterium]
MAARILDHPGTGERLIVHTAPEESAGALLLFEYVTGLSMPGAPDHSHADQQERVEVLAGTLHCRVDGRERVLQTGEAIVIPPGVPHAVWNGETGESRSMGEFRPAGETLATLEAYFGRGDA